ncbi:MAG: hypothetical protein IH571_03655 [Acholeplasmataceae bacterium]|nr:hypothetical protein [Acholeplasmataceae bacterium]
MKKIFLAALLVLISFLVASCKKDEEPTLWQQLKLEHPLNDVYYEIFIRSFADGDGDGIGDLSGITENLDYLSDLGVTGIWLMPIHPSSSYHGYDVLDYYAIHEDYGTMADFDTLIDEAEKKGIRVMIDLVINHSSDQHPWYLAAKNSGHPNYNTYRSYYFKPNGQSYKSFPGAMIDFNLESESTVEAFYDIIDFYIDKGVKGFRVDAAKHLIMDVNLETGISSYGAHIDNHLFLLDIKRHIKEADESVMLVSEIFDRDYAVFGQYYRGSDSVFNFHIAQNIINKVKGLQRSTLASSFNQSYNYFRQYNYDFIDAPFLTNHDEDRIANEMEGSLYQLERLKLASRILLTLPGSPFIYYGEELGMKGERYEGIIIPGYGTVYDEYRRQPFLWGDERNTTWLPSDGSNTQVANAGTQQQDASSLYHAYKQMIAIRKDNPALMFGNNYVVYTVPNVVPAEIQAYVRYFMNDKVEQAVLVIHNMSDKVQSLDPIEHEAILYGNFVMQPFETLILQIDASDYR